MTADEGQPLLEARKIHKEFHLGSGVLRRRKTVRAVDGVDLAVFRGEAIAIVGESGSGKTTLARCLTGLIRPTAGQVIFNGADVWTQRAAQWKAFRRHVQPIFQDPFSSLDPRWTVGRTIREALDVYGLGTTRERNKTVLELMQQVGLPANLLMSRPHELSGGQCQRVGIAAALAMKPSVVVADEPVSALDVSVRAQVLNLLARLREDLGLTLVLVTHDLSVVEHVCDRAAVCISAGSSRWGPRASFSAHPSIHIQRRWLRRFLD
jgi:ABC-type glutathione transport system ATPase component